MKIKIYFISSLLCSIMTINVFAQCTEEKDAEMAKYMEKTKNQDAQGCSQCGMLALYFCSAKYCVKDEDKAEVGRMIAACKSNIVQMGQPYCCPEYLNKEPQWGIMAGSAQNGQGSTKTTTNANAGDQSNPSNNTALGKDYRTTEDGINKLFNDADFINDVVKLGSEDLTLEKLDQYYTKYVPEYANFKNANNIDFNNIYYANTQGVSTDVVANKVGELFGLNAAQQQNLKNTFNGNTTYSPTNNLSSGYGNSLYERGKDAKVDYAVDYAVDFFQGELGDGGVNSALIDIGGGLFGALALQMNRRYAEKMAEEQRQALLFRDKEVYNSGKVTEGEGNMFTGVKLVDKTTYEQSDIQAHYKAMLYTPSASMYIGKTDFNKAISLLNEAINKYKTNADRAYYLYQAYMDRALCKMQVGAYRAAITDYYLAQEILENILSKKLPDNSIEMKFPAGYFDRNNKTTYLKGQGVVVEGLLVPKDRLATMINRAFAKYRATDYNGAIADAKLASELLVQLNIRPSGKPNDYKDIIQAIFAMSQFGLEQYKESYTTFYNANITDDFFADDDNDFIINFFDTDDKGAVGYLDKAEGIEKTEYTGLPNYFPFDIAQIKGLSYYKQGKTTEAIAIYENIVNCETKYAKIFTKVGGDISSVYSSLGSFYFKKGDMVKAISLMDQAILLNPNQLEYYFKRGTYKKAAKQLKAAEEDFMIVKNPESLKKQNTAKGFDYYYTEYTKYNSSNNREEEYRVIKEAIVDNPESEFTYFTWAFKNLKETRNKQNADELSILFGEDHQYHHILRSLFYEFSNDTQKEEEEIFLAFEKGLDFYSSTMLYRLNLREKSYYCRLANKYMSATNNNFIPANFDQAQKDKLKHTLDSIYIGIDKQYANVKGMSATMENLKKSNYAKSLGEYVEYLAILNSNKMLLGMSGIHALDKIECLFILNRKEEAIKFAKSVYKAGKIMKYDENTNLNARDMNQSYYAIRTIAESGCGL